MSGVGTEGGGHSWNKRLTAVTLTVSPYAHVVKVTIVAADGTHSYPDAPRGPRRTQLLSLIFYSFACHIFCYSCPTRNSQITQSQATTVASGPEDNGTVHPRLSQWPC